MSTHIVRPDAEGNVDLSAFGVEPGQKFLVSTDDKGRIFLMPAKLGEYVGIDGYIPGPLDDLVEKRLSGDISQEEFEQVLDELDAES